MTRHWVTQLVRTGLLTPRPSSFLRPWVTVEPSERAGCSSWLRSVSKWGDETDSDITATENTKMSFTETRLGMTVIAVLGWRSSAKKSFG